MRFIDVAIPKFGHDDDAPASSIVKAPHHDREPSRSYSRGGGFLQRSTIEEYNLEENESVIDDDTVQDEDPDADADTFFEAPGISTDVRHFAPCLSLFG